MFDKVKTCDNDRMQFNSLSFTCNCRYIIVRMGTVEWFRVNCKVSAIKSFLQAGSKFTLTSVTNKIFLNNNA